MLVRRIEAERRSAVHQRLGPVARQFEFEAARDKRAIVSRIGVTSKIGLRAFSLENVSLAFGQGRHFVGGNIDVEPAAILDPQQRRLLLEGIVATAIRAFEFEFDLVAGEVFLQDHVHDPAIGRIAELLRHFLRHNFDLGDRLGRERTHFAKTADADAVEQQDRRRTTPPPAGRTRLRGNRFEKFLDRGRTNSCNIFLVQFQDGCLFDLQLTAQAFASDDDCVRRKRIVID